MIDVSTQYKKAIKEPSRLLKSLILINNKTFTDTDIFSISYNEDLFMENEFTIGSAIMSCVEIELRSTQAVFDNFLEGKEMEIKIGIETSSNNFEYVSLGFFIIEDIEKEKFVTRIHANDRMVCFEKDYKTKMPFPATMKDIALDVAKKAGVELITDDFVNCDYRIKTKPDLTNVTLRKALMYIAELAGGYARITRDGHLEIFNINNVSENVFNYSSETLFSDALIANEINNNYNAITGDNLITFSNKGFSTSKIDKLVVEIPNLDAEMGEGANAYYIVDNLFCHNPNDVIENIYNVITKISYVPYEGKLQGDPALQVGDNISIKNNGGGLINTIITNRSLSYMGGLTEEYQAVGISTTEKHSTGKGSVAIELDKTKTEINVMAGEIEQKVSNEDFESTIKQTTDNITLEIKNTKEGLESKIEQTAESITLEVKNNKDELESKIEQTAESITLEVQNNKDELISKIEQTADSITLEVQNNKDELESKIEQTAESITAEVKNNKDELESRIEQTAESITAEIKNNKDELESRIEQTADSISSEIRDNKNELESQIRQTTKEILLEVADTKNGLQSQINVNKDAISQKVESKDFEAFKEHTDREIVSKVNNLQDRVSSAEQKITQDAIVSTVTSAINDGSGVKTTQFLMDKNGFTVKNGAIRIKNKAGSTVLSGDTNGNLTMTGNIKSQYGEQWVGLDSGGVTFKDSHLDEQVMRMATVYHVDNRDQNGVNLALAQYGDYIRFSHISKPDLTGGWSSATDKQFRFMDM